MLFWFDFSNRALRRRLGSGLDKHLIVITMATDNEHISPPFEEPIPCFSLMPASESESNVPLDEPSTSPVAAPLAFLQKFRLYETRSVSLYHLCFIFCYDLLMFPFWTVSEVKPFLLLTYSYVLFLMIMFDVNDVHSCSNKKSTLYSFMNFLQYSWHFNSPLVAH